MEQVISLITSSDQSVDSKGSGAFLKCLALPCRAVPCHS